MPRRLFDSEYLFGLHDPGGEQVMLDAGKTGWLLFTEEIGRDPNNFSGNDFTPWSNRNLGVICRLNNGYYPNGTIPNSAFYEDFSHRCANYVANSPGCKIWIIGNEMNYDIERPPLITRATLMPEGAAAPATSSSTPASGATITNPLANLVKSVLRGLSGGMGDAALFPKPALSAQASAVADHDPFYQGLPRRFSALNLGIREVAPAAAPESAEVITPNLYVRCYQLCRDAIHRIPGHADDQVIVGAVAPWNDQTKYTGNTLGDWVQYLQDILRLLGPTGCDGVALHTYTHGADPNLVSDPATMNPPFQNRHYQFYAYRDFMAAIPADMRQLAVYITEADEDVEWLDQNSGWVQRAYAEINWWNQQAGNQQIRALILYRWPNIDKWVIETKAGVIADFRAALANNYHWSDPMPPPATGFTAGQQVETTDIVNLRRTPGSSNKPANDVLAQMPAGSLLTVLSSTPVQADGLTWWNVRYPRQGQTALDGWAAQASADGVILLRPVQSPAPPTSKFAVGDAVRTTTSVNLRRTPGTSNKPANDILTTLPPATPATIVGGPSSADGLTWWQVSTTGTAGSLTGWVAETAPGGAPLIEKVAGTPPAPAPTPTSGTFAVGELITANDTVRIRRTPGTNIKAADDILGFFDPRTTLNILEGPRTADGLTWWRVGGITLATGEVIGWVAEKAPNDGILLARAPKLPGTNIADQATGVFLGAPFPGSFGIAQLWGENPQSYSSITYDGVPLKGHNGIDFLTPTGTTILATDAGVVDEAVHNDPNGFGNYVKLNHPWGESIYAHLDSFNVQPGQSVQRGDAIGRSNNTGLSFGPHLHFSIRIQPYDRKDGWGGYSDPLPYLNPHSFQLPAYVLDQGVRAVAAAAPAPGAGYKPLAAALGYAPDRPGLVRP